MTIRIESLEEQIELEDTFVNELKVGNSIYRGTIGPCDFQGPGALYFYLTLERIQHYTEEKKRHNPPINDVPLEKVVWKIKTKESINIFDQMQGNQVSGGYVSTLYMAAREHNIILSMDLISKIFSPLHQKVEQLKKEVTEHYRRIR